MQQLTLFGGPVQMPTRRSARNRARASASGESVRTNRWDLWSQETDTEKEMALFFLDIRNFTSLTERHEAFDVIHIVKKLFSTFQNIIRNHHGQIIETSGDGFYAAFGMNRPIDEAMNEAVQAGMAILRMLEQLNKSSLERALQQRIEVGIGIHAGKVATGNLALGARNHLVVMGYAVNIASRIQAATKEFNNNLIVSSTIFPRLSRTPENAQKVTAELKGVPEPMELYLIGTPYAA